MTLFQVTVYATGAGPDQSVSIQFWAQSLSQAQSRVYAELSETAVILDLKEHKRWARQQALSPGIIESACVHVCAQATRKIVEEGN